MRKCIWCDKPLPATTTRGHRRREFCSNSCKQHHYLWHKQMRHDAGMLADPYWRVAYGVLVNQYKAVENLLQDRLSDLAEERKQTDASEESVQYYKKRYEDLHADYVARLRGLGMNENDVKDFDTYWKARTKEPLTAT